MPLNGRNNNKRVLECHTLYNNGNRIKLFVNFPCHNSILTENEKNDTYKTVLNKGDFRNENWSNINCLAQVSLIGKFICEKKTCIRGAFRPVMDILLINLHINVPNILNPDLRV